MIVERRAARAAYRRALLPLLFAAASILVAGAAVGHYNRARPTPPRGGTVEEGLVDSVEVVGPLTVAYVTLESATELVPVPIDEGAILEDDAVWVTAAPNGRPTGAVLRPDWFLIFLTVAFIIVPIAVIVAAVRCVRIRDALDDVSGVPLVAVPAQVSIAPVTAVAVTVILCGAFPIVLLWQFVADVMHVSELLVFDAIVGTIGALIGWGLGRAFRSERSTISWPTPGLVGGRVSRRDARHASRGIVWGRHDLHQPHGVYLASGVVIPIRPRR